MRREWTGWIKGRQWDEFLAEAKRDPSQMLADTVAELALGFPEKADRRALKKVLYTLAQAGYRPTEPDEAPAAASPELRVVFSAAAMASANVGGETRIVVGRESGDRVRWLTAMLAPRYGFGEAREQETSLADAQAHFDRLLAQGDGAILVAPVPVDYALCRLAEALREAKWVPQAVAYWRTTIDAAPRLDHPGLALDVPVLSDADLAEAARDRAWSVWRLEMGVVAPILSAIFEAEKAQPSGPTEDRWAKTSALLAERRADLVSPDVLLDHQSRLLDYAYLAHLRGDDRTAGRALALRQDLVARGHETAYATVLAERSFLILVDLLETQAKAGREKARRSPQQPG